jgi:hypothetical protein
MLLLPASRPARQGNFSILRSVIRMSNRRSSTRSREQLSVTTSHEARSGALRLGDSAGPLGNFSILSLSVSLSNRPRATRSASTHGTPDSSWSGNPHPKPGGQNTQGVSFQMGGGSPLEGGKALGLSASLWGEQVISYVGSPEWANPGRVPGVSGWSERNSTLRGWSVRTGLHRLPREGPPPARRRPAPVRRARGCAGSPRDAL